MTKITIGGESLDIPKKEIEKLKEKYGEKGGRPRINERYYCLRYFIDGENVSEHVWGNYVVDESNFASGNFFWGPTAKKDAEMALLRRRAVLKAGKWVPEEGEMYFYWGLYTKFTREGEFSSEYGFDMLQLAIGNVHKTREEAQAWGEEYGEAFTYLANKK